MSRTVHVWLLGLALLSSAAGWAAVAPAGAPAPAPTPARKTAPLAAAGEDSAALTAQVRALFAAANAYWTQRFVALGGHYPPPTLTVFDHTVSGVCGLPQALTGPFYCPATEVVYLDTSFLQQALMQTAGNDDAALAYVIGHEVAHHVQNLIGTTAVVNEARSRSTPALSARTWMAEELQADCYAGLWLQSAAAQRQIRLIDPAALLQAVAAVSRQWQGHLRPDQVMPDPVLSYGTAAQRQEWFGHGLSGKGFADCDTFGAESAGKL